VVSKGKHYVVLPTQFAIHAKCLKYEFEYLFLPLVNSSSAEAVSAVDHFWLSFDLSPPCLGTRVAGLID
jgi:hypothetical protein